MRIRWYWHGWMDANKEAVIKDYESGMTGFKISVKIWGQEGVYLTGDTVLKYLRKWGTKMRKRGGKNR